MRMDDGFHDLAPLDPRRDPARWARMTSAVARAAAPELARRREMASPELLLVLSGWTRPALALAGALGAAAAVLLALGGPEPAAGAGPGVADALGYPAPVAVWVETDRAPSVEELLAVLDEEAR